MGDGNKEMNEARNKTKAEGYCGSCYGSAKAGTCCNTCQDVREAYRVATWTLPDLDKIEQVFFSSDFTFIILTLSLNNS